MKIVNKVFVLVMLMGVCYSGYGQITSFQTGNWSETSTWVDGVVPTSSDDVIIAEGHTVTVPSDYTAQCNNCSLIVNGTETRVAFGNDNSKLEIYSTLSASATANLQIIDNSNNNSKVIFKRTTDGPLFSTWGDATTGLRFEVDCQNAIVTVGDNSSGTSVMAREVILKNGTLSLTTNSNLYLNEGGNGTGKLTIESGAVLTTVAVLRRTSSATNPSFASFTINENGSFSTASTVTTGAFRANSYSFSNSSSVEFRSVSQQYIPAATYGDMILTSGTTQPAKNLLGSITVNGLFSIRGSSTFNKSTFSITYGNDAILQYGASGQSTAQITSDNEWPESDGPKYVRFWNTGGVTLHANRSIPENGIITLSSGTFNLDSKTLTLGNGVTIRRNAGTLSAAPTFGTLVNIEYGSTISSVTTSHEVPTISDLLNDVTISSTQGVTLGSNIQVNGVLTVEGSNLTTTNDYTLTLGSTATISESAGKTVVGNLTTTRTVAQNDNNTFGGIGVEINAAGASPGETTVLRKTGTATSGNSNEGIKRYFDITPATNTGLDATLVFKYDDSESNSIDESTLVLFKSTDSGTNWSLEGGIVNTTENSITKTGVNSFSRWTAGNSSAPLPVELTSFNATIAGNAVVLSWETATEINSFLFEIERSVDNSLWQKIGEVNAHGNSNSPREYTFAHENLSFGKYQYRLKIVDIDGSYEYSNSIEVSLLSPTEFSISQNYPNPFNPSTKIDYVIKNDSFVNLELFNSIGEKIQNLVGEAQSAGYYTLELNSTNLNLASGVYLVRFIATETNDNQKFTKTIKLILNK